MNSDAVLNAIMSKIKTKVNQHDRLESASL